MPEKWNIFCQRFRVTPQIVPFPTSPLAIVWVVLVCSAHVSLRFVAVAFVLQCFWWVVLTYACGWWSLSCPVFFWPSYYFFSPSLSLSIYLSVALALPLAHSFRLSMSVVGLLKERSALSVESEYNAPVH